MACWGALLLAGCAARVPAPQPAAPPAQPPAERQFAVREAQLENGAIVVHVEIPSSPPGRKPSAPLPIACADETERVLASAYARSGFARRFRYVKVTHAAGHGLGPREGAENLAWLHEWLVGAS